MAAWPDPARPRRDPAARSAGARGARRRAAAGWLWPLAAGLALLAGAAAAQDAYRIAVGDELQIDLLDDASDPLPLTVGLGGQVQLPFLGAVEVVGQPLGEARDAIADLYVDREIFVAPQIELSVVKPRPVSVLGDVRTPGVYDYQPFLTVEQAVGLAGGAGSSGSDEETRSLQRAALRAELASVDGSIAQEAVVAARLRAQLAGADGIGAEDVELAAPAGADASLIDALRQQENQILLAERDHFEAQRELLARSIDEARSEVALTEQQIVAQAGQVESYGGELGSASELLEDGLLAAPALARLQRQVADEERTLLQLRTNLSGTQRLLTGLEREVRSLDFERQQSWRVELVGSTVRMAQLQANRRALLERLALLDDWSVRARESEAQSEVSFAVRRAGPDGAWDTVGAAATDELRPGDTLIVELGGPVGVAIGPGSAP